MALIVGFVGMEVVLQYLAQKYGWGSANRGFSFGLAQDRLPVLAYLLLAAGVLVFVVWRKISSLGWWLVIAGGMANGVARMAFGQVTDYLHWNLFFSLWFNFADISITLGVILALWST